MNSDNFDNLFKEQILSLDHVAISGSTWNQETSWDRITAILDKPRRKIAFWFSAAAAIIILFGVSFLFLQPKENTQNWLTETRSNSGIPTVTSDKATNEKLLEESITTHKQIADKSIPSELSMPIVKTEKRNPGKSITPIGAAPVLLAQISYPKNREIIQIEQEPVTIAENETTSRALNRTYVLHNPNTKQSTTSNKTKKFAFGTGNKNKSNSHPPKGLLAGL